MLRTKCLNLPLAKTATNCFLKQFLTSRVNYFAFAAILCCIAPIKVQNHLINKVKINRFCSAWRLAHQKMLELLFWFNRLVFSHIIVVFLNIFIGKQVGFSLWLQCLGKVLQNQASNEVKIHKRLDLFVGTIVNRKQTSGFAMS